MKCPYCIKVCSKCGRILVAYKGNFYKDKKGKLGLESKCKNCKRKYSSQYYKDNKEVMDEYSKQYQKKLREENPNFRKEYQDNYNKKYYQDNKEKIIKKNKEYYEDNKEIISKRKKDYNQSPKGQIVIFNSNSKRRECEENQGKGIDSEQWFEMMEFFEWRCAYSGISLNKDNRSIDHIVPLNKYGEHEIWNCVPMYKGYNFSKQTSEMLEWYQQQEYFDINRLNKIYEWQEYAKNKWME